MFCFWLFLDSPALWSLDMGLQPSFPGVFMKLEHAKLCASQGNLARGKPDWIIHCPLQLFGCSFLSFPKTCLNICKIIAFGFSGHFSILSDLKL